MEAFELQGQDWIVATETGNDVHLLWGSLQKKFADPLPPFPKPLSTSNQIRSCRLMTPNES